MRIVERDIVEVARDAQYPVVAFTANAYVSLAGELVMGRGAARAVKDAFPYVPAALGRVIGANGRYGGVQPDYHLRSVTLGPRMPSYDGERTKIVALQVKRHFRDQDDPEAKAECLALTEASLVMFNARVEKHARDRNWTQGQRAAVNFPLIGNGGYAYEAVLPVVQRTLRSDLIDVLVRR